MNVSNYLANALLNQVFRNTAFTRPTTLYIALYISNPTAADTGQEVSGGGYARQVVTFSTPVVEGGKQTIKNPTDVPFPLASADWSVVSHIGIKDAQMGGNLLYFGALESPRSILTNDVFKLLTGQVILTLS